MQLPNGLTFYLPQTKWVPRQGSSFRGIYEALYYHLQGNPAILKQLGWPLDMNFMADKVDEYNAKIAETNGWNDYITEAAGGRPQSAPFPRASVISRLQRVAAGGKTLVEWIASGAESVSGEHSTSRAKVCCHGLPDGARCPHNAAGAVFTLEVSEAIREALNQRRDWQLSTPFDSELETCGVCLCPLKLKVHMPMDRILKRLDAATQAELPEYCWIKTEQK